MNLPNDVARCDGLLKQLLPYSVTPIVLWSKGCPVRKQCRRFLAMEAEAKHYNPHAVYSSHHHAPGDPCDGFIQDKQQ